MKNNYLRTAHLKKTPVKTKEKNNTENPPKTFSVPKPKEILKPKEIPKPKTNPKIKAENRNLQRRTETKAPVSKQGAQFFVIIWEDKAIKSPRKKMSETELIKLAEIQNSLSSIKGVPKTNYSNGLLVEDIAPGDTLKNLIKQNEVSKEEIDFITKEQERIVEEIKEKGYILKDRNKNNVLYDKKTKIVTLIDYYDIKNVSNLTKNAWSDNLQKTNS